MFSNIKINEDPGVNSAPWNLVMKNRHSVLTNGDKVTIDGQDLIVYHFGSLLIINEDSYDLWKLEQLAFEPSIISNIYEPYIYQLKQTIKMVKKQVNSNSLSPFFSTVPTDYKAKNPLQTTLNNKKRLHHHE